LLRFRPEEAKALTPASSPVLGRAQLLRGQDREAIATLEKAQSVEAQQLLYVAQRLSVVRDKTASTENPRELWARLQKVQSGAEAYQLYAFLRDWLRSPLAPKDDPKRMECLKSVAAEAIREIWK
jgi:hypothetical protein